jgi:hypothetical protein
MLLTNVLFSIHANSAKEDYHHFINKKTEVQRC